MKFKREQILGQSQENFDSIIGSSMLIKGDIVITNGIRIDGKVIGNIVMEDNHSATVAVSESAEIIGDIHAQHVIVSGKLVGNIFATERVELLSKSEVEGQISYGTIGIAVGAKIQGNLHQVSSDSEKPLKLISHQKDSA